MRDQAHQSGVVPPEQCGWLLKLLELGMTSKFFVPCKDHPDARKDESNIFCMNCLASICKHCLGDHSGHNVLQIRRYVYTDVIRIGDINKMVDCSGVQAYTVNGSKVVFLNERGQQTKTSKPQNPCRICDRSLQDEYLYCSMGCKIKAAVQKAPVDSFFETAARLMSAQGASSSKSGHETRNIGLLEPSSRSPSYAGSSGVSENDSSATSEDEAASDSMYLRAPKRSRTSRNLIHHDSPKRDAVSDSPKSVLPETLSEPCKPTSLHQLMQHLSSLSSRRRKSPPHRSPSF